MSSIHKTFENSVLAICKSLKQLSKTTRSIIKSGIPSSEVFTLIPMTRKNGYSVCDDQKAETAEYLTGSFLDDLNKDSRLESRLNLFDLDFLVSMLRGIGTLEYDAKCFDEAVRNGGLLLIVETNCIELTHRVQRMFKVAKLLNPTVISRCLANNLSLADDWCLSVKNQNRERDMLFNLIL